MPPKVPKKTSVYKKGPIDDKYTIQFAPELVEFIKKQQKVKTYRFGKKYDYLKKGDTIKIRNAKTKEIIGKAIVTNKRETIFKNVPINVEGHESCKDKEHQRKVFNGYYAYVGRTIKDNDFFLIIDFKLL